MGPPSPGVGQNCGTDPCGASPSLRAQWEASGESPRPKGPCQCWSQAWEKSRSARGLAVLAAKPGEDCSSTALGRRRAEQESRPGAALKGLRRDGLQEGDGPQQEPRARN